MNHLSNEVVDISLPADPRFFRLARMTAASVATDLGATEDAAVELRMAVDEACAVLIEGAEPDTRLSVECALDGPDLVVTVTSSATARRRLRPHPVAEAILAWAVARYEMDRDDAGHDLIRLIKPLGI
ncbi:MAG: ATP-binding protein [Aquihabitans sp.]